MTDPRWVTAVHEAGHIVASRVLGGQSVGAVLFSSGGGAAYVGKLGTFESALMTACGSAAECLAELHSPPDVADRGDLPVAETIDRDAAEDLRADLGPSDDRRIAEWAITGCEAEPDRWARRHAWIHREADLLVRRHERAILAVASELYVRGVAGPPGRPLPVDARGNSREGRQTLFRLSGPPMDNHIDSTTTS